jgi:predicted HD phosphohydrolase
VTEIIDPPRAWFTAMKDSTQEDWDALRDEDVAFRAGLADRVLDHLRLLDDQGSSFHVTRLDHSLQTATKAYRGGKDDDYVVCALLHDIGDSLGVYNHADIAAAVVKPFARPDLCWMVEKHAIFQGYYFFHYVGGDRNAREEFRGHEYFDLTAEFCEEFDQQAFDPHYDNLPLEHFAPAVRAFMTTPIKPVVGGLSGLGAG